MHSSISNSNARMTARQWGRTWVTALLVVSTLIGGWELFWRRHGFSPTLSDDRQIWAMARRKASALDSEGIVLLGSSRIQLGVNPDVIEAVSGLRPIMLAIDGSSPLPVLRDISADERFNSHVIISFLPMFLAEPLADDRAREWVKAYTEQKWSTRAETRLRMLIQQLFVFRSPSLAPEEIWSHWQEGSWPTPPYAPMQADRYRPGLFSRVDIEELRENRIEREREIHAAASPLSKTAFRNRVDDIRQFVSRIVQRGGHVAFVRMPSAGAIRRLEQEDWPRQVYWDVLVDETDVVSVHFEDFPQLQGYEIPDGSHLDAASARRFTGELMNLLAMKGFDPLKSSTGESDR